MARTIIAIACQGGGSQNAFTAGAIKGLLESDARRYFEVVGISGTSGGAVCATSVWYVLHKHEDPLWKRLIDFWEDNTAHGWVEEGFNEFVVEALRMANRGVLPVLQLGPSSPLIRTIMSFMTPGSRRSFTEFAELLRKYLDFDEISRWGASSQRPVLIIGASDVRTGELAKFVSAQQPIRLEHMLASCAVPNEPDLLGDIVGANAAGAHEFLDRRFVREQPVPIRLAADITQFDLKTAIRIPKSFASDPDKLYHIPCIEMPAEMQDTLDYEGKIDRSAKKIEWPIAQGEAAARRFLVERARAVADSSLPLSGSALR